MFKNKINLLLDLLIEIIVCIKMLRLCVQVEKHRRVCEVVANVGMVLLPYITSLIESYAFYFQCITYIAHDSK